MPPATAELAPPSGHGDLPAPEVEVRVLGAMEIVGAACPLRRAWAADLVVYLAMHPSTVANDRWAAALWPDRLLAAPTLHSLVSAARRSLGRSADGGDHLPRRRGSLRLGPSVGTDWHRFGALAATNEPADARRALGLVRGRPFQGLASPDWTVLEGFAAEVEERVTQVALFAAEQALDDGDPATATWAARQGLRVGFHDERLYRLLLRAADREGNRAGVRAVMAELVSVAAGTADAAGAARPTLDQACGLVHPQTTALYRRLLGGW